MAQPNSKGPIPDSSENQHSREDGPEQDSHTSRNNMPPAHGFRANHGSQPNGMQGANFPLGPPLSQGIHAGNNQFTLPNFGFSNPLMPPPVRLPFQQDGFATPVFGHLYIPVSPVSSNAGSGVTLEPNDPESIPETVMIPEALVLDVICGDRILHYYYRQTPVSCHTPGEGFCPQVNINNEGGFCPVDLAADPADLLPLLTAGQRQQLAANSTTNLGCIIVLGRGPARPRGQRKSQGQTETVDSQMKYMKALFCLGMFAYFVPLLFGLIYVLDQYLTNYL